MDIKPVLLDFATGLRKVTSFIEATIKALDEAETTAQTSVDNIPESAEKIPLPNKKESIAPKKKPKIAKAKKVKVTATAQVIDTISSKKKGIKVAELMELTGFNRSKLEGIITRAIKKGQIKRLTRGIYGPL